MTSCEYIHVVPGSNLVVEFSDHLICDVHVLVLL